MTNPSFNHGTSTGRLSCTAESRSNTPKSGLIHAAHPGDQSFDWLTDAVTGVPFDKDFDAAQAQRDLAAGNN